MVFDAVRRVMKNAFEVLKPRDRRMNRRRGEETPTPAAQSPYGLGVVCSSGLALAQRIASRAPTRPPDAYLMVVAV